MDALAEKSILAVRDCMSAFAPYSPHVRNCNLKFGASVARNVFAKSETAYVLGGMFAASWASILPTTDLALVNDGAITLYGESLPTGEAGEISFCQIILAAGKGLTMHDVRMINDCKFVKNYIEGLSVRNHGSRVWARVSRDAVNRGFNEYFLGRALASMVKEYVPAVEKSETILVIGDDSILGSLREASCGWDAKYAALTKDFWLEKGVDVDCPLGGHCDKCKDKGICAEVRKIQTMRKKVLVG